MKGTLFVISAPSGAGKTTLVCQVLERLHRELGLMRVITHTSKQPRPGERHGIDYYFLDEEEFKRKIAQDYFIEYSTVYGAYYGVGRELFKRLDEGIHHIAIVDRAGAASLKVNVADAVLIWIHPPAKEVLEQRLSTRAQDSEDTISFRLKIAEQELESAANETLFEHVIVNDDLQEAVKQLEQLIRAKVCL
jgi:guanylate kinase